LGRILLAAVVFVALVASGGCPPPQPIEVTVSSGQSNRPTTREEIVTQARREGELNWYTSLPDDDARQIAKAFTEQFPFIVCRTVRSGTFEIVRRIQSEVARGEVEADVLHVLDPGVFVSLHQAGQLYRYQSTQAKYLPPELRAAEAWNACRVVVTVIALRKDSPLKITKWSDLTTLPSSMRVGVKDAATSGSAYTTYYLLREKYGYSFWYSIAERDPRVFRSEDEMLTALERGEVDVLAGVMADTLLIDKRARIVWPADGVPVVLGPVGILAGAPHPNAAKLFVDFLLSRTGQELIRSVTGAYPARPGLAPPEGLRPLSEISTLQSRAPWDLYTGLRDYLQSEYNEIFRSSSE